MSSTEPGQVFKNTVCWRHLEQVAESEKRAIEMVVKSGLLKDLTKEDIKSAASTVILRDGCRRYSPNNLLELADSFGLKFKPLFPDLVRRQKELAAGFYHNWKPHTGILYSVSCRAEIEAFIPQL
ncbi:hypothetical protein L484_015877 [Morus notabilis]|uniref:Uncharacterized protein n=1 Tax=Morus notabilis TaxID=981085 RepID=W9RB87_9ROSA|nr:hypothetical protein L484_015877 [Morus notabilis]